MRTFTQLLCTAAMLLSINATAQTYCMLPGRTPYDSEQPGITEFKLNTIDRHSGNSESTSTVVVETGDSTTLERGKTYTVTIKHSEDATSFPGARNNIRVWIDYNGNKDFTDANETVISSDYDTTSILFIKTFTIPLTAPLGATRLRATAKMSSDAGHALPTPCDNPADPIGYHGEMEDYTVIIVPATGVNTINATVVSITVFPNPTPNKITISLNQITNRPVTVDLYDITGKLVANLLNIPDQSEISYNIDLDRYVSNTGMFFIKVSSDGISSYQKIIKTN